MKSYYRIMLGQKSIFAEEAHQGNFIGGDWLADIDLTYKLPDNFRDFNSQFIPVYLEHNPGKTKISAGLACGMLHTIAKVILSGDIVLCPNGKGQYLIGEIVGDYQFKKDSTLPHRRSVHWFDHTVGRDEFSEALRSSSGSSGTVCNISRYAEEIEGFISGTNPAAIVALDPTIEDPSIFALEKHLEEFLVQNWQHTELGKNYDILTEDGEMVGQQYLSDTGPMDILAISKDKKAILVVELKKGRVSDVVVGQIQRYMGYVKEMLAEKNQTVRGVIIGFEDDLRIRRALAVTTNIEFFTYKIHFKLEKQK